ncbi:MAG: DUF4440 domain-containing protein [Trueperaceae bacterium]
MDLGAFSVGLAVKDLAAEVLAVEDAYVAAEAARDEAALRRVIDDAFVYNASSGTVSGKDALIQNVLPMNMVGQTIRERTVRIEGSVAAADAGADGELAASFSRPAAAAAPRTAPPPSPRPAAARRGRPRPSSAWRARCG